MNTKDTEKIVVLACSIFRREIEYLKEKGKLTSEIRYISSMMHMCPEKLASVMDAAIEEIKQDGRKIVLLYGECHNWMDKYHPRQAVQRVDGFNCVEIFLGKQRYRSFSKAGAFFLLPEWTMRWREVFQNELGLKGDVGKEFMRDMHTFFLYVDTGLAPVPTDILDEISHTLGLPWKSIRIDLTHIVNALKTAVEKFDP